MWSTWSVNGIYSLTYEWQPYRKTGIIFSYLCIKNKYNFLQGSKATFCVCFVTFLTTLVQNWSYFCLTYSWTLILLCVRGKCQTGQIQKHIILLQTDFSHQSIRSPSDLCSVMHFHRQAPKPHSGSHAFLLLLPTSTGNYTPSTISRSLYKLKHSFMTMCIFISACNNVTGGLHNGL